MGPHRIGIGCIIGWGSSSPGVEAQHAAPDILSFVIAAAACACSALCYAELAAMIPVAGSAYTYGYATLGEIVAWIIGWDLILEYMVGASLVSIGWSAYLVNLIDAPRSAAVALPHALIAAPLATAGVVNLPARPDRAGPHVAARPRDPRERRRQPGHGGD